MKGYFYPNMRRSKALRESSNEGLSRIEITYTSSNKAGEDELLDEEFEDRVTIDLNSCLLYTSPSPRDS